MFPVLSYFPSLLFFLVVFKKVFYFFHRLNLFWTKNFYDCFFLLVTPFSFFYSEYHFFPATFITRVTFFKRRILLLGSNNFFLTASLYFWFYYSMFLFFLNIFSSLICRVNNIWKSGRSKRNRIFRESKGFFFPSREIILKWNLFWQINNLKIK